MDKMKVFVFNPCCLCRLSNRQGIIIIATVSLAMYVSVLISFLLEPEYINRVYSIPQGGQNALVVHLLAGIILSIVLVVGIVLEQFYLCLPWTIFSAFSVMVHFVGLIYASAHGDSNDDPDVKNSMIVTFIVFWLLFIVQVYLFWVGLAYVLELRKNKQEYEKLENDGQTKPATVNSTVFKLGNMS